ncbi:hypothetical protein ABTL91_18785, partial [Acinetobacter baumannii]
MDAHSLALIYKEGMGSSYNWSLHYNWQHFHPQKVYAWTVDLHSAPAACNLAIYRDIGVVRGRFVCLS